MAYIIGDSFDFYTVSWTASPQLTTLGPWTATYNDMYIVSSPTRFSSGKSLSWRDNSWIKKDLDAPISTTIHLSFSFYFNRALSDGYTHWRIYMYDATGTQLTLVFLSNGNIELRRGESDSNVVVATFANAYSAFTWQHFQIKIVIDSTNGAIYIRKNGDTTDTYSATGLNNQGSSTTNINSILFYQGWFWNTTFVDDLLINDTTGDTMNTWPGDIRCYALSPSGAGDLTDFTPTPTQANYLNVNESTPDTANYNTANTTGNTDLFAVADLPSAPATIHAVVARCIANKSDAGTRVGTVVIKSGTTVSPGSNKVLSTTYNGIFQPYTTNPDTGVAWTYGTVNSLQVGYKISG